MKPLDREYVEQNNVGMRYLHGRLTPQESEEFEVFLMENPDALAQLELDEMFRQQLLKVSPKQVENPIGFARWFAEPWKLVTLSVAAFGLGFLINFGGQQTSLMGQIDIAYLSATRSSTGEFVEELLVSPKTDTLVLGIQPSTQYFNATYAVTVYMQSTGEVVLATTIESNANGDLHVPLSTRGLRNEVLKVEYERSTAANEKTRFMIRIQQ